MFLSKYPSFDWTIPLYIDLLLSCFETLNSESAVFDMNAKIFAFNVRSKSFYQVSRKYEISLASISLPVILLC